MKIMFLGAAISNHTLRWVNSLSKKGHDVLMVCRDDQKNMSGEILDNVQVHYLKYGGGLGYYLNAFELNKVYKKYKPDIVNAHYATGYGTLARAAKVSPLVISCLGSDVFDFPFHNPFCKKILLKNFNYADAVASTSVVMAKKVKEIYPKLRKNIYVTPFGVDINLFKPDKIKKNERPIIGIVKYLKPIYDIPLLIKAFSIVHKQFDPKPILHIYGGGPLQEELEKMCSELEISKDVFFFGTIPNVELPKAINAMDIFVNCSKRESFGVALVEAMACEIPVIATDTEGFREVVENGVTGTILRDRMPETLADEIVRLLNDSELSESYGKNGRKRVMELYNWDDNVETMIKLYTDIILQKRSKLYLKGNKNERYH